jgi:hypothetical protein
MRLATASGLFLCAVLGAGATATTTPRADAVYDLSIAGIPIGNAALTVEMSGGRYVLTGSADVGFLFWGGEGGARAEGRATGGVLEPASYRLAYEGVTRPGRIEIDFEGGRAVRWNRLPEPEGDWAEGRTEVTPADLERVLDPLSALVIPMPRDADPAQVCRRLLPVFSGYTRFDLELTGPAAAPTGTGCTARYRPVAGHRPDSEGVARMRQPGAFEIALSPITDSAWGPARVAIQTRFGTFEMLRSN